MRIVYVITQSDVIGGASVHLLDLASGARQQGHEVVVLAGGDGVFLERVKAAGLNGRSLRHLCREIKPRSDLLGLLELRRVFKELKPDLVHLHSSKAGILGRLAAKSLSLPTVFTAHGWAFTEGVSAKRRALYRVIERYVAGYTDRIITVSDYDRRLALEAKVGSAQRIRTVHNGMPRVDVLPPALLLTDMPPTDAVRLIMVARFDEQKNHLGLLEGLARVANHNWTLELVGDGPLLESVRARAAQLELSDRVVFSGSCNDVARRLAQSDVFVLISNWEGLPLSILEAMRAGLPVIASRVGGVPEAVVDGETGYLVERGDAEGLGQALTRLLESPELRQQMGRQGKTKFEAEFTFDTMLARTLAVYNEVLGRDISARQTP